MNSIWHIGDPLGGSCDARRIADGATRRLGDSALLSSRACLALLAPAIAANEQSQLKLRNAICGLRKMPFLASRRSLGFRGVMR